MGTYINKGNAGFTKYTRGEYVDKTKMIAYINATLGTSEMLTCMTRPRRFGKSMAANMLCAYYDQSCDSRQLFAPYQISQQASFQDHLNRYPTIFIDITSFTTRYADRDDIIDILQQKVAADIRQHYPAAPYAEDADLMDTLLAARQCAAEKFFIIIDEWDAICRELSSKPKIQDDYINLLRRMFKTNDTAEVFAGVYMTGILPIKKFGTQSALNDFREYSMTSPGALGGYFGFCDDEVKALAAKYGMDHAEMKRWYDGYELDSFDWLLHNPTPVKVSIYNPNSVMSALRSHKCDNYWSKTEAFETLQQYIDMDFEGVKQTLENLIQGISIPLRALRFGNDMNSISSNEELFTLLAHLGYLSYNADTRLAVLPNQEIREEFVEALRGSQSHAELSALVKESDHLLEATWQMDADTVAEGIDQIHNHKVAPNFYNNEQALRSVIRMAYLGAIDHYIDIEELPSGKGYADLVFIPRRNSDKPTLVVELKWAAAESAAIKQIKERQYPDLLKGFTSNLLLIGINYDPTTKRHTCCIEQVKDE